MTAVSLVERAALSKLFDTTGGKRRPALRNWDSRSGWKTGEPLQHWFGVTLNGSNRVDKLELGGNTCRGYLPRELGDLFALTVLDLYRNSLSGPIPPELGTLTALRKLELSFNTLSGVIPPSLGKLSALAVLDLSYNKLSGSLPDELGDLFVLQVFRVERNKLTGAIPATFVKLTKLRVFRWKQHHDRTRALSGGPEKNESIATWREKLLEQQPSSDEVDTRQDQVPISCGFPLSEGRTRTTPEGSSQALEENVHRADRDGASVAPRTSDSRPPPPSNDSVFGDALLKPPASVEMGAADEVLKRRDSPPLSHSKVPGDAPRLYVFSSSKNGSGTVSPRLLASRSKRIYRREPSVKGALEDPPPRDDFGADEGECWGFEGEGEAKEEEKEEAEDEAGQRGVKGEEKEDGGESSCLRGKGDESARHERYSAYSPDSGNLLASNSRTPLTTTGDAITQSESPCNREYLGTFLPPRSTEKILMPHGRPRWLQGGAIRSGRSPMGIAGDGSGDSREEYSRVQFSGEDRWVEAEADVENGVPGGTDQSPREEASPPSHSLLFSRPEEDWNPTDGAPSDQAYYKTSLLDKLPTKIPLPSGKHSPGASKDGSKIPASRNSERVLALACKPLCEDEQRVLSREEEWSLDEVSSNYLQHQASQSTPDCKRRDEDLQEAEEIKTREPRAAKTLPVTRDIVPTQLDEHINEILGPRMAPRRSWGAPAVTADPVLFSCLAPPAVSGGMAFLLRVSAYVRQQREEVLQEAQFDGVVEAEIPGAVRIMRNKRVTIKLDLPREKFQVLPYDQAAFDDMPIQSPFVRDFVWTGHMANADFKIVQAGSNTRTDSEELETWMEEVRGEAAVISSDELEIKHLLGSGIQGETFAGIWRGKPVAIKCLSARAQISNPEGSSSALEHEAAILSRLGHHPHIVEFYGFCQRGSNGGSGTVEMVTKLEEGGSLEQALGLVKGGHHHTKMEAVGGGSGKLVDFNGSIRTTWARDIACGLANSHAAGVVHNDVACRNALLSGRGVGGRAVLSDFGISDVLRGEELEAASLMNFSSRGEWPLRQLPKEAWGEPYALSAASDSWMFGTMLYELFAGRKPFADLDISEVRRLVLEGKRLETPEMLKNQGPNMVEVYEGCLSSDWWNRPTMENVVAKLTPTALTRSSIKPTFL